MFGVGGVLTRGRFDLHPVSDTSTIRIVIELAHAHSAIRGNKQTENLKKIQKTESGFMSAKSVNRAGGDAGSAPVLLRKLCCKITGLPEGDLQTNT